jgi:hypothetical protein
MTDISTQTVERLIWALDVNVAAIDPAKTQRLGYEAADTLRSLRAALTEVEAENERLRDSLDMLKRQNAVTDRCLGNLLATIHRDGGHHQAENGDERSTEDALGLWADLMAQGESAEARVAELEAERDEIARRALMRGAIALAPRRDRPCDCDAGGCYCGNPGDARTVADWDNDAWAADAIRALADDPAELRKIVETDQ